MSWHNARLANLRKEANLDPLPAYRREDGAVDQRYWTPRALHYLDAVLSQVEAGYQIHKVDALAFARVVRAIRDGYRPTAGQSHRYRKALSFLDYEFLEACLFENEISRRVGLPFECIDDDQFPTELPSPYKIFKLEAMKFWNVKDDAVDKRVDRLRDAYKAETGTN